MIHISLFYYVYMFKNWLFHICICICTFCHISYSAGLRVIDATSKICPWRSFPLTFIHTLEPYIYSFLLIPSGIDWSISKEYWVNLSPFAIFRNSWVGFYNAKKSHRTISWIFKARAQNRFVLGFVLALYRSVQACHQIKDYMQHVIFGTQPAKNSYGVPYGTPSVIKSKNMNTFKRINLMHKMKRNILIYKMSSHMTNIKQNLAASGKLTALHGNFWNMLRAIIMISLVKLNVKCAKCYIDLLFIY